MRKFLVLLAVVGATSLALGATPVIDGSASDPLYGNALAVQDTETGYGDANLGRPDVCNGSELDGAFAAIYQNTLYLVFAGNFETNGNRLNIFFDTRAGGQNTLLPQNASTLLQRMAAADPNNPDPSAPGLTFASNFFADYWVGVSCFGSPVGIFVNYAELYADPNNPGAGYYCGAGEAACTTVGGALTGADVGAPVLLCTANNRNVLGVVGGEAAVFNGGAGVVTGIEIAIPLAALGNPTSLTIAAFITDPQNATASNQFLEGLFGSPNLGETRSINLSGTAHLPFGVAPVVPVGACCVGGTCSITTQASCSGTYLGDNVSCEGNPCTPPYGRCCVDDGYSGLCYVVEDVAECDAIANGMPYTFSANETCEGCPCLLDPKGACCVGNTCSVVTEADCADAMGDYRGDFSSCESNPCEAGACCLSLNCTEVRRFECSDPLARFYPGVLCSANPCNEPTISTPHVAGQMNGWSADANPMTETSPGSRIWTCAFAGLAASTRLEFKITNGTWAVNLPGSNSWCFTDPNGDLLITYDSNFYGDGWAPDRDRLPLPPYSDPATWTAAGSFQDGVPGDGTNDWSNSNALFAMTAQGSGVYLYQATNLQPNDANQPNYYWKPVITGSWDSISWNSRSINTANIAFQVASTADVVKMWVDAWSGTVKTEIVPAVTGACCYPDGSCAVTTQAACTGTYEGDGSDCDPNPCPPPICRGDCNCDGTVGFADIDLFVAGIPDRQANWAAKYLQYYGTQPPAGCWDNTNVNATGTHCGFDDIDPFVKLIPTPCAPRACCFPDHSCQDLVPGDCLIAGGTFSKTSANLCAQTTCP